MPQDYADENRVILRDAATGKWLLFKNPLRVISTAELSRVLPALHEVEAFVQAGRGYAAGFLSYEAAPAFDPHFRTRSSDGFPLIWFGLYENPEEYKIESSDPRGYSLGEFIPSLSQPRYRDAIRQIKQYLLNGDTYQVNYTLRMRSQFSGDPWRLFLAMISSQPSVYSAFINTEQWAVCSASPELFFRMDNGHLLCKPMKGTVQRGRTNQEDAVFAHWLEQSEKNRAENLMIVDMIRNDLGMVAEVGSVRVPVLFETERYPTLWQMTSTVTAECSRSLEEIMVALFPCASITGAPKIRTMEIIAELEHDPRHLYTGSIGYISPRHDAQFSVAIRTALIDKRKGLAEYGAGGGIVADSLAEEEYAEALLKAKVFTERPEDFSLLETLLWTPEEGYFLFENHLQRLSDSARYFDYPDNSQSVRRRLLGLIPRFEGKAHKIRLLLARDGREQAQYAPMNIPKDDAIVRVMTAKEAVQSSNVFLFHKTTKRQVYEQARAGCPDCDDVLLWNERRELTESTIANLVVDLDGKLVTPPLNCGLLAGTFRRHLLEKGEIQEQTIRLDDLNRCRQVFLINSVRKWQRAIVV